VADRLKAIGPAAGTVVNAGDFDAGAADAIRNNVGGLRNHELTRAGNAARRAELGMLREEAFDTVENVQSDPLCSGGIVLGDMGAQCNEVSDRFGGPDERHTLFGTGRSLRVSQEATQSVTRECAMPSPRSSDASAFVIPAICHSLMSRKATMASAARYERERPVSLASF